MLSKVSSCGMTNRSRGKPTNHQTRQGHVAHHVHINLKGFIRNSLTFSKQTTIRDINVCVAVIAICIRSVFRYRIKRILLSGRRRVNLWRVSPALTTSEVFELRHVLIRALFNGHYFFVLASLFCVVVASVGAASTVISNYSVVSNPVIRNVIVQGQNITRFHSSIKGAILEVSSRVKALDRADSPLDELFDFAPNDNFHWIYRASQWNNTWKGTCTFTKHDAVELVVYPTNSSQYQIEVPLLGNYIPRWATEDGTKQGVDYVGLYEQHPNVNATGSSRDTLVTYFFDLAPDNDVTFPAKTANISIANYLAHGIGRGGSKYQANAAGGSYVSAAQGISGMYVRQVAMNSTAKRPIIQPTGKQMTRYWQAYMSVKDSQSPNPAVRTVAIVQDTVQMRLSSLLATVGASLLAVITACVARYRGVKYKTHMIQLPSSQLDWIVQAAREHAKTKPETQKIRSRTQSQEFAILNQDNFYIVSSDFDSCIAMDGEPEASILESLSSTLQSPYEEEFDPWIGYKETDHFSTSRS